MSNTEVKIIPIFSTILHPTDLVVTEKQTKDLMNLTQTIEWNPRDDVDNISLEYLKSFLIANTLNPIPVD